MACLTVLDASVLLAHFDDSDAHADAATAILAAEGDFAASTITLAEVLVGAARAQRLEEQLAALETLEIREVAIGYGDAAQLARLRAETGLRMPDCCVLHAAIQTGADAVGTRDDRLRRVAGSRGLLTP